MKNSTRLIFAGVLSVCFLGFGAAAQTPSPNVTVLSPEDVKTYREIFAAQESAQISKADSLMSKLSDRSLEGYVLQQRYLLPRGYATKFPELKSWLTKYADHVDADRIYKLALKKAPKPTGKSKGKGKAKKEATTPVVPVNLTAPANVRWRGRNYDQEGLPDTAPATPAGQKIDAQLRAFEKASQPELADAMVKGLTASASLPQSDIDRLAAFVAAAYLAEHRDHDALALSEEIIGRGATNTPNCDWIAGLAAYRLADFDRAAQHFEAYSQVAGLSAQNFAGGTFWAARSLMRAGRPERVVALYTRASAERVTFYGALAGRVLGREPGDVMVEPTLEPQQFSQLMQSPAAHRAVALWQIGYTDAVEAEMARAFAEITPQQDGAYAALARGLGDPYLEMRAAEDAARDGIYLTGLYPVPPYQPKDGYSLDPALVLAFARQESRFNAHALSPSGARGVMQLMPPTAALVSGDKNLAGRSAEKLDDPAFNMALGQSYLRDLLGRQNNNLFALAAAYNSGPGNLQRWMASQEGNDDALLFVESIPSPETRAYIKRVMMNLWMYRKRLNEPVDGLDEAASGAWPIYSGNNSTVTRTEALPGAPKPN